MKLRLSFLSGLVLATVATALVAAYAVSGAQADPRASKCPGVASGHAAVAAQRPLQRLSEAYGHLPAMKHAPEIDRNPGPGFLVVYRGDLTLPAMGPSASGEAVLQDAICLVRDDGGIDIYYNVSREGFRE